MVRFVLYYAAAIIARHLKLASVQVSNKSSSINNNGDNRDNTPGVFTMNRESGDSFLFRRRRATADSVVDRPPQDPQPQRIDVAFPTATEPSPRTRAAGSASLKAEEKTTKPSSTTEETPRQEDEDGDEDESSATVGIETAAAVSPPPLNVIAIEGGAAETALGYPTPKNTGVRLDLQEVDFYRQPTPLSRLILYQKYGSALQRLHNHPDEARVWVCAKRRASDSAGVHYMIRQLPIHLACANLGRTHDLANRQLLHELLSTLIYTHPDGAHAPDHQGRLPLHEAVWYGAEPDLISLFLMAQPSALHTVDNKGRTLQQLNQYRPGSQVSRAAVEKLLNRSVEFWATARNEAKLRRKQNRLTFPSDSDDHQSLSSMCTLASSQRDDDSIATLASDQQQLGEQECHMEKPEIALISWEQLEQRAVALEHILTEVNENNYELNQRIEALTVLNRAQSRELVQELTRLHKENLMLSEKVHDIENLLLNATPEENKEQYRLALAEISSLVGLSNSIGSKTPILDETKEAHALRKELSRRTSQQRVKIRKMKIVLEGLFGSKNNDAMSHGGSISQDALSIVSPLTSNSSKSSRFSMAHPRFVSPGVEPSHDMSQQEHDPIDDLHVLLQFAAAHDHAHRERRRQIVAAAEIAFITKDAPAPAPEIFEPDSDDLSVVLRRAASHEMANANKRTRPPSVSSSWSPNKPMSKYPSRNEREHTEWVLPALLPFSEAKSRELKTNT